MKQSLLLAALAAGTATPALAETGDWREAAFYLGAGPAGSAIETSNGDIFGFGEIQVRGGYIVNKYFSIEAQAAIPLDTYETDYDASTVYLNEDVELVSEYGLFAQPRLPLGKVAGLYGRIGYVIQRVDLNTSYGFGGVTSQGLAVGAGFDFDIGRHFTIAVDYTVQSGEFENAGAGGVFLKGRF